MSHTKEPWHESTHGGKTWLITDEQKRSSGNGANGGFSIGQLYGGDAIANARRIVACVNACAGVQTKTLEHVLAVGGVQIITTETFSELERRAWECDELLAAARKAMAECCDLISTPAGDALAAAIAKHEAANG